MIKINNEIVEKIEKSFGIEELQYWLQKAIELEHSTIPPYLTAAFSIDKNSANEYIRKATMDIAIEEMLHFTIACNILIAIGGRPIIYSEDFIPKYPTTLPLSINNSLVVGLEKASRKLIKDVFLEIEEPEHIIFFPEKMFINAKLDNIPQFSTIGLFYEAIKNKLSELLDDIFIGNEEKQVVDSNFYSPQHLFFIKTKTDAIKAIDLIVEQGEGTKSLPTAKTEELAHYYRFKEILVGRKLVKDINSELGFSYTGKDISFVESDVNNLWSNTKLAELDIDSSEYSLLHDFNKCYCQMLKSLQLGFDGDKNEIQNAFFSMFDLSSKAEKLVKTEHPKHKAYKICPSFEYVPL